MSIEMLTLWGYLNILTIRNKVIQSFLRNWQIAYSQYYIGFSCDFHFTNSSTNFGSWYHLKIKTFFFDSKNNLVSTAQFLMCTI